MGESIEIDAKFVIEFVKVSLDKCVSDGALFRLVYAATNVSGKTKPARASGKLITMKEQISFTSTFLGLSGKIESKNSLSISLKEKSSSNSSKELGKVQLALSEYIYLDLIKTSVLVQKNFPLKKAHDLPALEMKIECKIVKFRKGNVVYVVNEKGECEVDENLSDSATLVASDSKRKSWRLSGSMGKRKSSKRTSDKSHSSHSQDSHSQSHDEDSGTWTEEDAKDSEEHGSSSHETSKKKKSKSRLARLSLSVGGKQRSSSRGEEAMPSPGRPHASTNEHAFVSGGGDEENDGIDRFKSLKVETVKTAEAMSEHEIELGNDAMIAEMQRMMAEVEARANGNHSTISNSAGKEETPFSPRKNSLASSRKPAWATSNNVPKREVSPSELPVFAVTYNDDPLTRPSRARSQSHSLVDWDFDGRDRAKRNVDQESEAEAEPYVAASTLDLEEWDPIPVPESDSNSHPATLDLDEWEPPRLAAGTNASLDPIADVPATNPEDDEVTLLEKYFNLQSEVDILEREIAAQRETIQDLRRELLERPNVKETEDDQSKEDLIPLKFLILVDEMKKQIAHYEDLLRQREEDRKKEWADEQVREASREHERAQERAKELERAQERELERAREVERMQEREREKAKEEERANERQREIERENVRSIERARDKVLLEELAREKEQLVRLPILANSAPLGDDVAALKDEIQRLREDEAKYLKVIYTLNADVDALKERERVLAEERAVEKAAEKERERLRDLERATEKEKERVRNLERAAEQERARLREVERAEESQRALSEAAARENERVREREREKAREEAVGKELAREAQVDHGLACEVDAAKQVVEQWRERRKSAQTLGLSNYESPVAKVFEETLFNMLPSSFQPSPIVGLDARTEFLFSQYLGVPLGQRHSFFQPLIRALSARTNGIEKPQIDTKGKKKRRKTASISQQSAQPLTIHSHGLYFHEVYWFKQVSYLKSKLDVESPSDSASFRQLADALKSKVVLAMGADFASAAIQLLFFPLSHDGVSYQEGQSLFQHFMQSCLNDSLSLLQHFGIAEDEILSFYNQVLIYVDKRFFNELLGRAQDNCNADRGFYFKLVISFIEHWRNTKLPLKTSDDSAPSTMDPLEPLSSPFARLVYLEETAQLLVIPKHFLDPEGVMTRSLCPSLSQKQVSFLLSHCPESHMATKSYHGSLGAVGKVDSLLVDLNGKS